MKINHQRVPSKVMLLTKQLATAGGGREMLCRLNHDALKEIYGEHLVVFELPCINPQGLSSVFKASRGHIDGLNDSTVHKALQVIEAEYVGKVFVDGSNLGGFARVAKRKYPHVEITTFFHNVEAKFFFGSLREKKTLRSLAILAVNYLAERDAVRDSEKLICLNKRDSQLLKKLYGREATHVSPMAVQDIAQSGHARNQRIPPGKYALFVGGGFYANRSGISWFVKQVAPRIGITTCIVGRGLDDLKPRLERDGKVIFVGAVDSLVDWYRDALFVIAPIFDGSGMKTKVAEALMFGKKIIGTPEAFSGYQNVVEQAGWVCATADEFVTAISRAEHTILNSFHPELRALYEKNYSYPAARTRLHKIMEE